MKPIRPPARTVLSCAALALAIVPAAAQEASFGNADAGRALAEEVCATCHAVAPGEDASPSLGATPFAEIAATPGMTGRAINVWLTTFHPDRTMPAIVLTREEREDIIAYIMWLGEKPD